MASRLLTPYRVLRARLPLVVCYALGAVICLVLPQSLAIRAVVGWDAGSFLYLAATFFVFIRTLDRDISLDAKSHQEGEWTVFAIIVLGAIMSFASIFLFSQAADRKAHESLFLAFVAITLALSWAVTHTSFAYRYAHEYYSYDLGGKKVDGGIDFPKDDRPDYLDFVYFSFVLGMTFQVSDCDITSKKLRRLATLQGIIGFLFNSIILAITVNIAASLL